MQFGSCWASPLQYPWSGGITLFNSSCVCFLNRIGQLLEIPQRRGTWSSLLGPVCPVFDMGLSKSTRPGSGSGSGWFGSTVVRGFFKSGSHIAHSTKNKQWRFQQHLRIRKSCPYNINSHVQTVKEIDTISLHTAE